MKKIKSIQTNIQAGFAASLAVLLYLIFSSPTGAVAESTGSMLVALFRYGLDPLTLGVFAFRSILIYVFTYCLTGLLLSIWKKA